jgi:hypothetical protein
MLYYIALRKRRCLSQEQAREALVENLGMTMQSQVPNLLIFTLCASAGRKMMHFFTAYPFICECIIFIINRSHPY